MTRTSHPFCVHYVIKANRHKLNTPRAGMEQCAQSQNNWHLLSPTTLLILLVVLHVNVETEKNIHG